MSLLGTDHICEMRLSEYRRLAQRLEEILSHDAKGIEQAYYPVQLKLSQSNPT